MLKCLQMLFALHSKDITDSKYDIPDVFRNKNFFLKAKIVLAGMVPE